MEGIQQHLCEIKASCYQALQTQKDKIKTISEKIITIATPYFNRLTSEIAKPFNLAIIIALFFPKLARSLLLFRVIIAMARPTREENPERDIELQEFASAGTSD